MLLAIVIACKSITLLSSLANSPESVITLAGDRSLITEDLSLLGINKPYLLNNDVELLRIRILQRNMVSQ